MNELKNKIHKFVNLHNPFFKFKSKLNSVNFRGVLAIFNDDKIIPLFIFLKKDKNNGENISWINSKKIIENEFEINLIDLENGDFEEF